VKKWNQYGIKKVNSNKKLNKFLRGNYMKRNGEKGRIVSKRERRMQQKKQ
jgi:hypothetical protein